MRIGWDEPIIGDGYFQLQLAHFHFLEKRPKVQSRSIGPLGGPTKHMTQVT